MHIRFSHLFVSLILFQLVIMPRITLFGACLHVTSGMSSPSLPETDGT